VTPALRSFVLTSLFGASGCAATGTELPARDVGATPPPAASAPRSEELAQVRPAPSASALPPGWTSGAPVGAPEPPPSPGSARALFEKLARATVQRTRVSFADLPVIDVAPIPTGAPANGAIPAGEPASDLFVAPGCSRASVRGHRYGKIRLDWIERPIAPQSGAGVDTGHVRPDIKQWKPASWQTLEANDRGALVYESTWAWFDINACKATVIQRIEVTPLPIADGLAYAFRTRCQACAIGKQEILHVLTPSSEEALAHAELSIDAGTTASTVVELNAFTLERFKASGAHPSRTKPAVIGVDVQRGVSDAEPVVTEFVADPPPH